MKAILRPSGDQTRNHRHTSPGVCVSFRCPLPSALLVPSAVAGEVRRAIAEGEAKPGERLPPLDASADCPAGDGSEHRSRRPCFYCDPTSALREGGWMLAGLRSGSQRRVVPRGARTDGTSPPPVCRGWRLHGRADRRAARAARSGAQPSAWDDPIAALRAGVPHTTWTVDDLDAAHARAVGAGGRSVWTPRSTAERGLRIAWADVVPSCFGPRRLTSRSLEGTPEHRPVDFLDPPRQRHPLGSPG